MRSLCQLDYLLAEPRQLLMLRLMCELPLASQELAVLLRQNVHVLAILANYVVVEQFKPPIYSPISGE